MRIVRLPLFAGLALLGCAGCDALNKVKSENPVFPAPPPRLSLNNDDSVGRARAIASQNEEAGDVRTVGLRSERPDPDAGPELSDSEVVATVNGQPIFASEVLDRYSANLAKAKETASAADYRKLREFLIRRDLPGHIDRRILVQNLRATLKPEQLKMLGKHLDAQFEAEVERMMKQLKVSTRPELDEELARQQTTLETLKQNFLNQRMAMEYLAAKSKYDRRIGRRELFEYYQAHLDDYSFPAEVRWQQILVSFDQHGGKDEAYQKALRKVIDELKAGGDFGEVAKKHSDGPTKANGGYRDWMPKGSLDDESIEKALFELDKEDISQVFVGERGFQIVKVVDRREAGTKPFEDVQDEIRDKVEFEARKEASQSFLNDLKKKAVIESAFLEDEKESPMPLPFR